MNLTPTARKGRTWGQELAWIDYAGIVDGRRLGLLVVPAKQNARPAWAHSRDYGVMVINPFPRNLKENAREPATKTLVEKGKPFRLEFTLLAHDTPADQPPDLNALAAGTPDRSR